MCKTGLDLFTAASYFSFMHDLILRLAYDCGRESFFEQFAVWQEKGFSQACLDNAFTFGVGEEGTLFGLNGGVAADLHETFYNMVKGVDLIVVEQEDVVFVPMDSISGMGVFFSGC